MSDYEGEGYVLSPVRFHRVNYTDLTRQYLRHQIDALPYEVFGLLLFDLCGVVRNVDQQTSGPESRAFD